MYQTKIEKLLVEYKQKYGAYVCVYATVCACVSMTALTVLTFGYDACKYMYM